MENICTSAYTSKGFVALKGFEQANAYTYYLKGYPKELKQNIIENAAKRFEDYSLCRDYNGIITGMLCEEKNICVLDAAYPFKSEPLTYGATDRIIDLSKYQNIKNLKENADSVLMLMKDYKKQEARCVRYLAAAKGIVDDCKRIERDNIDIRKLNRYASKLWQKYGEKPCGKVGTERKCFTDYVSKDGVVAEKSIFEKECSTVIIINDFFGTVADMIIEKIRLYALGCGADVISSVDFLHPDAVPYHIVIPGLGIGIYREQKSREVSFKGGKRIYSGRFYLKDNTEVIKNRFSFSKKAYSNLIDESAKSLQMLNDIEFQLENVYLSASNADNLVAKSVEEIVNLT